MEITGMDKQHDYWSGNQHSVRAYLFVKVTLNYNMHMELCIVNNIDDLSPTQRYSVFTNPNTKP